MIGKPSYGEDFKPEDIIPEDFKPEDIKYEDVKPENFKPEDFNPEDFKPEDIMTTETVPYLDTTATDTMPTPGDTLDIISKSAIKPSNYYIGSLLMKNDKVLESHTYHNYYQLQPSAQKAPAESNSSFKEFNQLGKSATFSVKSNDR